METNQEIGASDIKRRTEEILAVATDDQKLRVVTVLKDWKAAGYFETIPSMIYRYLNCFYRAVTEDAYGKKFFYNGPRERYERLYPVEGLPVEYGALTLSDLTPRPDVSDFAAAVDFVTGYCDTIAARLSDGNGATFCGDIGTGKTALAVIMAKAASRSGPLFATALKVFEAFRPSGDQTLQNAVLTRRFLILDDVGSEYASEWTLATLDRVITERYNAALTTVITTNYYADELAKDADLAPRVLDRLEDRNATFTLRGPSYRQRRKEGREVKCAS